MFDDAGYETDTSDKGRYESATLQKFGGLEQAGHALWSTGQRALLLKYLDKSQPKQGVFDEGVFLKDGRRYLNFKAICLLLGEAELSRDVIDRYLEHEISYRGFIFRCSSCSDVAWHAIANVDHTFVCGRCGLRQQYTHASWNDPDEPSWFYKLDEMVYLMLKNNGHVPLLTLNKLRIGTSNSFLFRTEIRLKKQGCSVHYQELDICCVIDGKLCIGEAKSNDSLAGDKLSPKQTAERYRDIALQTGALIVVFATASDHWDKTSANAIESAFFAHPHIEVRVWAAKTLFG